MLVGLLLVGLGDPAGPAPTEVERRFEQRAAAALATGEEGTLTALLAEGSDLLPALLDRWAFAAYLRDPPEVDTLARAARLREAAGSGTPPFLELRPERLGEWRGAIARFKEAREPDSWRGLLAVFESLGDRRRIALLRLNLGRALADTLDGEEARDALARAREYAESLGDTSLLAFSLEVEAQCLRDLEFHADAADASKRALGHHRRLGDRRGEAEDERGIAVARGQAAAARMRSDRPAAEAEWSAALAGFERALEIHRTVGDEVARAKALRGRGSVRLNLRDFAGARADLEAALEVFERRGDRTESAVVRVGLSDCLKRSDPEGASEHLRRAARDFAEAGAMSRIAAQTYRLYADALLLGLEAYSPPDPDALRFYRLARAIDEKRRRPDAVAQDLDGEARVLYRAGEIDAAEAAARDSLALFRSERKDDPRSSSPLLTLGRVSARRGRYAEARSLLDQALALARVGGEDRQVARCLNALGGLLEWVGETSAAGESYREAARLAGGDLSVEFGATEGLARIGAQSGEAEESVRLLEEVARHAQEKGQPIAQARALANLATFERLADPRRAKERVVQARRALGENPAPRIRASLSLTEGDFALAAGEWEAASAGYRSALESLAIARDPAQEASALFGLTESSLRGGIGDARDFYLRAVSAFSRMRSPTLEEPWRIDLQDRYARLPSLGVETFLRLGDDAGALAAAEDAQGRALAEALEGPGGSETGRSLLERLRARLGQEEVFVSFAAGLDDLHAFVVRPDGLRRIDLGPRGPVADAAASFGEACQKPVAASAEAVRTFAGTAASLKDLVWKPLAPALDGCRAVAIAPGALLSGVPFEALPLEVPAGAASFGEVVWAIERFAFSYVPSARVLVALSDVPANRGRGLLAVADPAYGAEDTVGRDGGTRGIAGLASRPASFGASEGRNLEDLPFSRVEATAVAALLPESERTMRLGAEATLGALAPGGPLEQARFVLISTHGRSDERERSACGLWLSAAAPGEAASFFAASALASREMLADFVVLSACSTNRGRLSEGEGVLSLAREFLRAGSRAVVASEWLVEDAATASVSIGFHEGVLRDGLKPAEALRRAKVRYLRDESPPATLALRGSPAPTTRSALDRRHPFFWAPLLLFGPGR